MDGAPCINFFYVRARKKVITITFFQIILAIFVEGLKWNMYCLICTIIRLLAIITLRATGAEIVQFRGKYGRPS
jgi:hypothetical protein